jgi:hypothetical protein
MTSEDLFDELNNAEVAPATKARPKSVNPAQTKNYDIADVDKKQKSLLQIYKSEPLVPVRVAPSYAKYFGSVMRVSINGIVVSVKCDGKTVQVPETYATEINRRMANMDAYDLKTSKMANVRENLDVTPGSLNFFG